MVECLQHLQLIVDHLFVPTDIFLQDDFDGDLSGDVALGLTDNTICTCTKGSSEFIRSSRRRIVRFRRAKILEGRVWPYFFS